MQSALKMAAIVVLIMACGEQRRPVAIDVQSNDSTVKTDRGTADSTVMSRKGFAFINPMTGLEVPNAIAVPPGAAVRIGYQLNGVRSDDYTVGFARGSSTRFRFENGNILLSSNLPEGVHEFVLVARNTRSCTQLQRSAATSTGAVSDSQTSGLRCNIERVEVPSSNFDLDVTTTLRVTASSSAVAAAIGSPRSSGSNSNAAQGSNADSDLDSRVNSQFGLTDEEPAE
jgi:hypothetical protein